MLESELTHRPLRSLWEDGLGVEQCTCALITHSKLLDCILDFFLSTCHVPDSVPGLEMQKQIRQQHVQSLDNRVIFSYWRL